MQQELTKSSNDSLHSEGLSNGDKILDEVYLFDLKEFARTSLDI